MLKHSTPSPLGVTPGHLQYGLLVSCTTGLVLASMLEVSFLSDLGWMQASQEARLYQLGSSLAVASCVIVAVASGMGLSLDQNKDMVAWLDAAKALIAPALACLAFLVVGPALMLLNKHIMEDQDFPYPLSLSGLGLAASCVGARAAVALGLAQVRPETQEVVAGSNWWKIVFPIGTTRAVTLATGNAVYLYLSLGFIQMLKAFTPAIILVVMLVVGVETPARSSIWCVMIIVAGTLVEVNGELQATALGLILMMTSSVGEAISTVMSQKLLQNFKFSEIETMYFLSLPSVLVLALPACVMEWGRMIQTGRHALFVERPVMMVTAALLGVAVNFVTLTVVRATSSVTVKILNTFRCIGLVAVGSLFYGESHTTRQMCGYAVSLVGFVGYNFFQLRRDKAAKVEACADRLLLHLRLKLPCWGQPTVFLRADGGENTVPNASNG